MPTITVQPEGHDPTPEPYRDDYPSHDAYLLAWYTWRAQRRDGELNPEENAAAFAVLEGHIRARCAGS